MKRFISHLDFKEETMITARGRARRSASTFALVGVGALALTACAGGGTGGGSANGGFSYLGQTQNTSIVGTLDVLAGDQCAAADEAAPLKTDAIDGTTWDQQLQLLAGQGALSNMSMAGGTPSLMQEFIDAGQVLNLTETFDELGIKDRVLPAAESTIKALYGGGDLYALPTEFNIEGFWYNKQILSDNGIDVPATWGDLVDAAATLDAGGVQPFIAAGKTIVGH